MAIAGMDFAGLFSSNWLAMFGLVITVISLLIAAAAITYFLYWMLSFNIEVEYIDKRNNGNRLRRTWAKKIIEDGVPKLRIWAAKKKRFKIPANAYVLNKGKKDKILMTRDFDGSFNFMKIDLKAEKTAMEEVPPEARLWESLQYRKNFDRFHKQTFWDKFGDKIIQYGFIMILMVMLIILFTKFQIVADTLTQAVKAAEQCQRM